MSQRKEVERKRGAHLPCEASLCAAPILQSPPSLHSANREDGSYEMSCKQQGSKTHCHRREAFIHLHS